MSRGRGHLTIEVAAVEVGMVIEHPAPEGLVCASRAIVGDDGSDLIELLMGDGQWHLFVADERMDVLAWPQVTPTA